MAGTGAKTLPRRPPTAKSTLIGAAQEVRVPIRRAAVPHQAAAMSGWQQGGYPAQGGSYAGGYGAMSGMPAVAVTQGGFGWQHLRLMNGAQPSWSQRPCRVGNGHLALSRAPIGVGSGLMAWCTCVAMAPPRSVAPPCSPARPCSLAAAAGAPPPAGGGSYYGSGYDGYDGRGAPGYGPGPGMMGAGMAGPGYRGGPRPGYPYGGGGFACVRLRGLPFGVTERDIVLFLVGGWGQGRGVLLAGCRGGGRAAGSSTSMGGWLGAGRLLAGARVRVLALGPPAMRAHRASPGCLCPHLARPPSRWTSSR